MTTLVLNQIPRFPAHISASNGLTAIVENGVDVVIVPSYGDLVPVPAVTKPATTYFMAWDAELDYYQSISFDQLAENLAGRVLGTTLTAQIDLHMLANQAIYFTSPTVAAAYDLSTFVRGISGSADAAAFRTAIGLGNVNNTSDANKPVSTAQQTALNLKANASDLAALTARTISGAGLATGGGDLTASRTITVTKSTNAQAIAGTDDTTAMTPVRTKEAVNAFAVGGSQTWQAPSRSVGSVYQNTTGQPIQVHVSCRQGLANTVFQVSTDNSTWVTVAASTISSSDGAASVVHVSAIVPSGHYYRLTGTSITVASWAELRT